MEIPGVSIDAVEIYATDLKKKRKKKVVVSYLDADSASKFDMTAMARVSLIEMGLVCSENHTKTAQKNCDSSARGLRASSDRTAPRRHIPLRYASMCGHSAVKVRPRLRPKIACATVASPANSCGHTLTVETYP